MLVFTLNKRLGGQCVSNFITANVGACVDTMHIKKVGGLVPILHIAEFVLYCRLVPNLCTILNSTESNNGNVRR